MFYIGRLLDYWFWGCFFVMVVWYNRGKIWYYGLIVVCRWIWFCLVFFWGYMIGGLCLLLFLICEMLGMVELLWYGGDKIICMDN